MFILRLIFLLAIIFIAGSLLSYVFTGNKTYIAFAWKTAKGLGILVLAFLVLLVAERVLLLPL